MSRRFTWSWADYRRRFPEAKPAPASAVILPFRAPSPQPPAPSPLPAEPGRDARMSRARELLAMGVEGAMVRRCVRLSAEDLAALGIPEGAHEPGL